MGRAIQLHIVQLIELQYRMDERQYRPGLMVGEAASFRGSFQAATDLGECLH